MPLPNFRETAFAGNRLSQGNLKGNGDLQICLNCKNVSRDSKSTVSYSQPLSYIPFLVIIKYWLYPSCCTMCLCRLVVQRIHFSDDKIFTAARVKGVGTPEEPAVGQEVQMAAGCPPPAPGKAQAAANVLPPTTQGWRCAPRGSLASRSGCTNMEGRARSHSWSCVRRARTVSGPGPSSWAIHLAGPS